MKAEKQKRFKDVVIRNEGTTIILPAHPAPGMEKPEAIEYLQEAIKAEEAQVRISCRVDCFPIEGLVALMRVLERRIGFTPTRGADLTIFGAMPAPPTFRETTLADGSKIAVPDGGKSQVYFSIPGVTPIEKNTLTYTFELDDNQLPTFVLQAICLKKYQNVFSELFTLIEEEATKRSLYKGQALLIDHFPDLEELKALGPFAGAPKFLDISRANRAKLVFSKDLETHIEALMFAPMLWTKRMANIGIGPKRAVLLEGPPGTGKTELAFAFAKSCVERGITFALLKNTKQFDRFMLFLRRYAPARGFVEDIDQIASGDRDESINDLLNTMSGILTKRQDIGIIATTNNVDVITSAMLRPERFDAVIRIDAPDAKAAERLIRLYSNGLIDPAKPLPKSSAVLAGLVPAFIREAVDRAKLFMVARQGEFGSNTLLTDEDVAHAAATLKKQEELVNKGLGNNPDNRSNFEKGCSIIAKAMHNGAGSQELAALTALLGKLSYPAEKHLSDRTNEIYLEDDHFTGEDPETHNCD